MPESVRPLVRSFLEASPVGMDHEELVAGLHANVEGISPRRISAFLDKLVKDGFLVRDGNKLQLAEELEATLLNKTFRLGRFHFSLRLRMDRR